MTSPNNRQVFNNAVALTLRMVLVTIVGLYTSRVVLQALGVDDYGIYGVVGGIVGMASFLNTSMAGATSRFITYEIGTGNTSKLRDIFSTALVIHFAIAICVVVLAETVGLWFLNHKMVIPPERMGAANIVYQFSVLSMVISFTQVPYTADIIAHEKMSIYAYFEIVNVVLKLTIVFLLLILNNNRLIFYAGMTTAISIFSAIFYRWYCIKNFKEAKFSIHIDKTTAKQLVSFSAYDLYGNMCVVIKNQGNPTILNLFFSVIANAAASIALTVLNAVEGLTSAISQAFRPQIIKQYASGDICEMGHMMRRSVQFTLLAFTILAIPMFLETYRILYVWLGQIPKYSVDFVRLLLITEVFLIVIRTSNAAIHATGNIKYISFLNGTCYLLVPIIGYIILKYWLLDALVIYCVDVALTAISMVLGFIIIKRQIKTFLNQNYIIAVLRSFLSIILSFLFCMGIREITLNNIIDGSRFDILSSVYLCLILFSGSCLSVFLFSYLLAFSQTERTAILTFIKKLFNGLCKGIHLRNTKW